MTEIKYSLSDLEMDEISFVDAGDNPDAHIVLFKRNGQIEDMAKLGELKTVKEEDGNLYVTNAKGEIFVIQDFEVTKNDDGTSTVEGEPQLLVDAEEDPAEPDDEEEGYSEKGIKAMFRRVAKALGVSVDEAALEKAKFGEIMQSKLADQAYSEMYDLTDALRYAFDAELYAGNATAESLKASLSEFDTVVNSAIEKWTNGQLLGKARDEEVAAKVAKRDKEVLGKEESEETGDGDVTGGDVPEDDKETSEEDDDVAVTLEDVLAKLSDEEQAFVKARFEDGGGEEDVFKGMPPAAVAMIKSQQNEIKKMQDEKEEAEYIGKCRGLDYVPAEATELGKVMRRVAKGETTEEDQKFLLDTFKSVNEVASQSGRMFAPMGKLGDGGTGRGYGSAAQEMESMAKKVASEKGVPVEVAYAQIRKDPQHGDLVARYSEEVDGD
jgi:hypothetical protein